MHKKKTYFKKLEHFSITNEQNESFVVIWLIYECLKSDNRFESCPKYSKHGCQYKWTNKCDERHTWYWNELETHVNLVLIFSLCLQLLQKVKII